MHSASTDGLGILKLRKAHITLGRRRIQKLRARGLELTVVDFGDHTWACCVRDAVLGSIYTSRRHWRINRARLQ